MSYDVPKILAHKEEIRSVLRNEGGSRLVIEMAEYLIGLYLRLAALLGFQPAPDHLRLLGWPGELINQVACKPAGMWGAFCRRVEERRPDLTCPTPPRAADGTVLASLQEMIVYEALRTHPSLDDIGVHPVLGGPGPFVGDFRIRTPAAALVLEAALVGSDPSTDTSMRQRYRADLERKIQYCRDELGFEPAVIYADEILPPRRLARRLNEIFGRLGLDTLPVPPPLWFEEDEDVREAA